MLPQRLLARRGALSALPRLSLPLPATPSRGIHAELRPEEVASKAMRRKLVAKRARAAADAAAADAPLATTAQAEAEDPRVPGGVPGGMASWLGANMLSGFAMALGFSAVAILARVIFGDDRGDDTRLAWLDAADAAAARGGGGAGEAGAAQP